MSELSSGLDSMDERLYNNVNDEMPDFSEPIRIDMTQQKPLNDATCQHDWYLDDKDEDSSFADVWKCRNCPLGKLVQKVK